MNYQEFLESKTPRLKCAGLEGLSMQRIQVHNKRFGYKVGVTFVAVKGYTEKNLSFVVPRPVVVNRKTLRKLIIDRMAAAGDSTKNLYK